MSRHSRLVAVLAVALAGFVWSTAGAQPNQATTSAGGSAVVVQAISITKDVDLNFGELFAGAGGTVIVSPGGVRTKTGDVTLGDATGVTQAQFDVTGDPGATYAITLPDETTLSITAKRALGVPVTMVVDGFTSTPSPGVGGTIGGDGTHTIHVGATLNVNAGQTPGTYSGTFDVTVAYD